MTETAEGQEVINTLYRIAKTDKKVKTSNKIQKKHRDNKNIQAGKPIRKVGRPRKKDME
jgi:hypothetical protein